MRAFITGATGFIGTHVVRELIGAGHEVLGLARSEEAVVALAANGADAHRGRLEDVGSLQRGAATSDAVIHLGFDPDFSRFAQSCTVEREAIEALGTALVATGKPLLVPNGLAGLAVAGRPIVESDAIPATYPFPRASEQTALRLAAQGVRASVIRLPQVHGAAKQGLASALAATARRTRVSAYVGEGRNRWAAAHVSDVARLFRLVMEAGVAGATYHAIAEEGIEVRRIAEIIGRVLGVPVASLGAEQARDHFGPLAMFVGAEMSATAEATRARTGWAPAGPGLAADLERIS